MTDRETEGDTNGTKRTNERYRKGDTTGIAKPETHHDFRGEIILSPPSPVDKLGHYCNY